MERVQHLRKKLRRCGAALLMAAVLLLTGPMAPAAEAVSQADIDALKGDVTALSKQREELQARLNDLKDDKSAAVEKKNLLDRQSANLQSQISNIQSQISTYAALITQTEAELADAEQREAEQYELFCKRVRAMEERGTISYWSVLFKADSFTDLLSRLDFIQEIMQSDQGVIDDLKALQVEIQNKQTQLEGQKSDAEAAKASLQGKKSELDQQRAEADALVKEIQSNESEYRSTLAEIDAEEEAIQAKIVKLSKELAAQQAAQNGGSTQAALGGYIWPVSSHRVTSPFGTRNTGIKGASTNHKGVDIGGVGYTTEVHAAKAGTVIISQRSSSYGEYVVISHGSGNTTLYAHMSSRKVAVGTYVNQGDVVGITGSTGISSGPHLHFEITENSVRVDPLKYLTGYVKAW